MHICRHKLFPLSSYLKRPRDIRKQKKTAFVVLCKSINKGVGTSSVGRVDIIESKLKQIGTQAFDSVCRQLLLQHLSDFK